MGLVTLPGTEIQYFSFSEEVIQIASNFFKFVLNVSPGWIIFITTMSIAFVLIGIVVRLKMEAQGLAR